MAFNITETETYKSRSCSGQLRMLINTMRNTDPMGNGVDARGYYEELIHALEGILLRMIREEADIMEKDEADWSAAFSVGSMNGVLLVGALNSLAEKSGNGIIDFDTYADAPEEYEDWVVYNKSNRKVVCDTCVDELHRDIVGYYDFFFGANIHVIEDDSEDSPFIEVTIPGGTIVIEDGRWYVCCYD